MPVETKDPIGNITKIDYDVYHLLPETVTQKQSAGTDLVTIAEYDYRVMQAKQITDPNGNRTAYRFTPLGLLKSISVMGKESETLGDEPDTAPGTIMEYDFMAFVNEQQPVWVKTIKREYHTHDSDIPDGADAEATITTIEFTDGFGRLLQTRTQGEDVIFGQKEYGDSGLPDDQTKNGIAKGKERSANDPYNVVVSGWQVYDNKGQVIKQYEPFFDKGFAYNYNVR
ncbi:MAG: hypothetical protein EA412_14600 [Chitinophagaceae bacterium]|nr:MAG: hypothetical protein EA412_14600 [Chitinophagaceae bacterium]